MQPPEQLDPAKGKERPIKGLNRFVEVRQRHHEGDRFAVQLGNADQVLEHNWLQFLAGMGHLSISDRDEAPIIAPGIVQDGTNDRGFLIKAGLVHLADADRSEEHTSELQSLMLISYAVFCLKK